MPHVRLTAVLVAVAAKACRLRARDRYAILSGAPAHPARSAALLSLQRVGPVPFQHQPTGASPQRRGRPRHAAHSSALPRAGQNFIFWTITGPGPLVCTMLTTLRKFFTILLSVLLFPENHLTHAQWVRHDTPSQPPASLCAPRPPAGHPRPGGRTPWAASQHNPAAVYMVERPLVCCIGRSLGLPPLFGGVCVFPHRDSPWHGLCRSQAGVLMVFCGLAGELRGKSPPRTMAQIPLAEPAKWKGQQHIV